MGSSTSDTFDTGKADRLVWLLKCPMAVSQAWQQQQQQSQASSSSSRNHPNNPSETPRPLAKVFLSVDPLLYDPLHPRDNLDSRQFTMELVSNEPGNVPKSYSMNMAKDFIPMCVFSETSQGKVSMEGKMEEKFDMKPNNENFEEYGKLCRERTKKSMIKSRQVQVVDNDRGVHMRPMPGMVGLLPSNSKDKKKTTPVKGSDMKRTRRDRGELQDIMFKHFERQPNWTLKQLVEVTDQPAQFLKEILNELCVYNKRGTHQGTYELKPEYKKSNEEVDQE